MRTPAGKECAHYYQDFHRGRAIQECRLLERGQGSRAWEPRVCSICPVPDILRANRCPYMRLRARLVRRWMRRRVELEAYCTRQQVQVKNPYVGCGHCHPDALAVLGGKQEDSRK